MVSRPAPASTSLPSESSTATSEGALPESGRFWRELLEDVRDAVLVQDVGGALRWSNPAARELFGGGRPILTAEGPDVGHVEHTGRRFPARIRTLPGGWHAWTVTSAVAADGPRVDGFLAASAPRLASARGRHGTAKVIAEVAAAELADCVFVLLPTTRGRWEWWSCDHRTNHGHGRIRRVPAQLAPVLAGTFASTEEPEAKAVPEEEVATLPAIVAERLAVHPSVTVVSLGFDGGAGVTGAVVLGRRGAPAFGEDHPRAVTEFARAAGTALANAHRYARQEEATRGLETTLRPTPPPDVHGVKFDVWYEPSGGLLDVGGDFYDVLPREGGGAMFVLGDVCGKGAEAAALTGRVRQTLAALDLVEHDNTTLLSLLNSLLITGGSGRFATLVLGSVLAGEDGLGVTLASGGHPAPLVVRRRGGVDEITLPGTLVGISPQARFAETAIRLAEGDVCLLYTDGITEARHHERPSDLFGDERLRELLAGCQGMSGRQVVARIRTAVREWLGNGTHDDIAVLAIEASRPVQ
ncbi:SpoIIE family protein phosphatase [Amycolatopsis sp. EV170708-02-1]|uniref:SpoIIE family protein phosphatase n=1 Tax=Amycolatopsis sp. EV170708-02-1 TaxID=2919322 RepID=UPI001F0CBBD5|nr:SpoIIE family protein phosphatase [Amycolatopsis sp. EV170708-02-1]UMP00932.1 SpoIIE family protein phosphatase [Amycolatopsis sp. EV170708-02-1]